MRQRGPEWRYPNRKRCLRCRRYFGFLVVEGLYDSYPCAGRSDPSLAPPDEWPREHFARVGGERKPKRAWAGRRIAERQARLYGKEAYVCGFCNEWHIGSPSGNAAEAGD